MTDYILIRSPLDRNIRLCQPDKNYIPNPELKADYASIVSALNWLACIIRPDISYTTSRLSRYLARPTKDHLHAAKKVLRYLAATATVGLNWGPTDLSNGDLIGYSDSSWNDDIDNGKSTAGYLFKLWNGPISWRSKQEQQVAMSSTEAEYIAAAEATKEVFYIRDILEELGYDEGDIQPIRLLIDNQSTIKLANNPTNHPKTKHIRVRYHFIRDAVHQGDINIKWIRTEAQAADPLTKAMPAAKLNRVHTLMGIS